MARDPDGLMMSPSIEMVWPCPGVGLCETPPPSPSLPVGSERMFSVSLGGGGGCLCQGSIKPLRCQRSLKFKDQDSEASVSIETAGRRWESWNAGHRWLRSQGAPRISLI